MLDRSLILIKHAKPEIIPSVTASQWHLSELGRSKSDQLAVQLRPYQIKAIVTSREPKAIETGAILGDRLQIPLSAADNLHEHDRSNVIPNDNQAHFEAQVANFFAHPSQLVFGQETAEAASERFNVAITTVLAAHSDCNVAIVTHGTVITLFAARYNKIDSISFWKRLGLPSIVVLSLPAFQLLDVIQV